MQARQGFYFYRENSFEQPTLLQTLGNDINQNMYLCFSKAIQQVKS